MLYNSKGYIKPQGPNANLHFCILAIGALHIVGVALSIIGQYMVYGGI